ncbi:MAG: hypothetical protein ACYC3G_02335 [Minisyncoccota bacterium]
MDELQKRIEQVSGGIEGIRIPLTEARQGISDVFVILFLDRITEKGDALWARFKAYQEETSPDRSFIYFMANVVMA